MLKLKLGNVKNFTPWCLEWECGSERMSAQVHSSAISCNTHKVYQFLKIGIHFHLFSPHLHLHWWLRHYKYATCSTINHLRIFIKSAVAFSSTLSLEKMCYFYFCKLALMLQFNIQFSVLNLLILFILWFGDGYPFVKLFFFPLIPLPTVYAGISRANRQ